MCDSYYTKWMQKDTGMMIMLPKTLYGKDLFIAQRIKHEFGFRSVDMTLKPLEVDIDIRRAKPESPLTIDAGNIITDSVTFHKLIEFCGSNNIKFTIINGHINLNV